MHIRTLADQHILKQATMVADHLRTTFIHVPRGDLQGPLSNFFHCDFATRMALEERTLFGQYCAAFELGVGNRKLPAILAPAPRCLAQFLFVAFCHVTPRLAGTASYPPEPASRVPPLTSCFHTPAFDHCASRSTGNDTAVAGSLAALLLCLHEALQKP